MVTELIYQTDSYVQQFQAEVNEVKGAQVALDRTAFFPGGGSGVTHETNSQVRAPSFVRAQRVRPCRPSLSLAAVRKINNSRGPSMR